MNETIVGLIAGACLMTAIGFLMPDTPSWKRVLVFALLLTAIILIAVGVKGAAR